MSVWEVEIRKLRQEMRDQHRELMKLVMNKMPLGNWVDQVMACAMLKVSPRQLRNIRIHSDQNGKVVGTIRWRKGKGKQVQYHKQDLENYLNKITIS
jgi:hypothetical protein